MVKMISMVGCRNTSLHGMSAHKNCELRHLSFNFGAESEICRSIRLFPATHREMGTAAGRLKLNRHVTAEVPGERARRQATSTVAGATKKFAVCLTR
jgi:hypothetical protein